MESNASAKPKKLPPSARLATIIRNPVQFRMLSTVLILGGWYAGFAMPTSTEIDELTKKTTRESKRIEIATEVERLRTQVKLFDDRLPKKSDPNEWVQYILDGARKFPEVKLSLLDTDGYKEVGPYKGVILRMEVEGKFEEINNLLRWLESNPRLLRVDLIRLDPRKGMMGMVGQFTLVGVMG